MAWAETLGACASYVVSLAHRGQTGRTACKCCSTPFASYRSSANRSYAITNTLWKVNCGINYWMNDRAILLQSLCAVGQSVTCDTCHLCRYSLLFEWLWHQLIKQIDMCLITSRQMCVWSPADRCVSDHQQTDVCLITCRQMCVWSPADRCVSDHQQTFPLNY